MPRQDTQFKPGKSGNPAGRPVKDKCIPDILRDLTSQKYRSTDQSVLEQILQEVINSALLGHRWAVEFIADRLEGRPVQVERQIKTPADDILDNL